jgi:hypothetical protein
VVLYEPRPRVDHRVSSTIGKLKRPWVRRIERRNRLIWQWINLHDGRMLASHAGWVLLSTLTDLLRLKFGDITSCVAALKLLPEIRRRRLEEKRAAKRSDREVLEIFAAMERGGDVFAYDKDDELQRFNQTKMADVL